MPAVRGRMGWGRPRISAPTRLGFGKYRGMVLAEVPSGYLVGLASWAALLPTLCTAILTEPERRRMESGAVAEARDLLAELNARTRRPRPREAL